MSRLIICGTALVAVALGACTSSSSATDLNPAGPPMVRQVMMTERVIGTNGAARNVQSLAFGHHPDFNTDDDGVVVNATVTASNEIRVILDELLLGNQLEQIACRNRGGVENPNDPITLPTSFQSIEEGTTPDDIAACSVANDTLPITCKGKHAVCFAPMGTTCPAELLNEDGKCPIGVLDQDLDGASDDTQFIVGKAHIKCGNIDVPLDPTTSFWQPAGDQQVPAAGGFNSVGPAVILHGLNGLPTSSMCGITFDPSVTDKDHIQICAPTDGDIDNDCTPGDTSLIHFGTEPLRVNGTNPPNNATNVPLTSGGSADAKILVQFNAPVDPASISAASFTLDEGGAARAYTATVDPMNGSNVNLVVTGGFVAGTTYTLTVNTDVTDQFGIALPADPIYTITWMTAP